VGAVASGEPVKPLPKLSFELQDLRDETAAVEWKHADRSEHWRHRLNDVLSHVWVHDGKDVVPDDFALEPGDSSASAETVSEARLSLAFNAMSSESQLGLPIRETDCGRSGGCSRLTHESVTHASSAGPRRGKRTSDRPGTQGTFAQCHRLVPPVPGTTRARTSGSGSQGTD
jgi:hypothetical protein